FAHDIDHKPVRDLLRRELTEFTQHPRVAPAGILTSQLEDKRADVDASAPSGLARLLADLGLAEPALKGGWRDDGDELLDGWPPRLTQPVSRRRSRGVTTTRSGSRARSVSFSALMNCSCRTTFLSCRATTGSVRLARNTSKGRKMVFTRA